MTGACRCGHGRASHYPTANATRKRRNRGNRTPANPSCHALLAVPYSYTVAWRDGTPATVSGIRRVECKCRKFVAALT